MTTEISKRTKHDWNIYLNKTRAQMEGSNKGATLFNYTVLLGEKWHTTWEGDKMSIGKDHENAHAGIILTRSHTI